MYSSGGIIRELCVCVCVCVLVLVYCVNTQAYLMIVFLIQEQTEVLAASPPVKEKVLEKHNESNSHHNKIDYNDYTIIILNNFA